MELGLDVIIRFDCPCAITEWVSKLNQIFMVEAASLDMMWRYRNNYISVDYNDFYNPKEPINFEEENYPFEIFVAISGISPPYQEEHYQEQIALVQHIKNVLQELGCELEFIFSYYFPAGKDPIELLK